MIKFLINWYKLVREPTPRSVREIQSLTDEVLVKLLQPELKDK